MPIQPALFGRLEIVDAFGIYQIAKIDTGAYTSSMHADDIEMDENTMMASFTIAGTRYENVPMTRIATIRSSFGSEQRPATEIVLRFDEECVLTEVTLTDRSSQKYPMLIGRKTLEQVNGIVYPKMLCAATPATAVQVSDCILSGSPITIEGDITGVFGDQMPAPVRAAVSGGPNVTALHPPTDHTDVLDRLRNIEAQARAEEADGSNENPPAEGGEQEDGGSPEA